MTEQEYRKALHEIRVKAEKERVMLARKFATEHSPVKIGLFHIEATNTTLCLAWYIKARPARRMALHASTRRSAGSSSATFCD